MLLLEIDPRSVEQVGSYLEETKLKIFAKMRAGMQEAMEALGAEAVLQAMRAGIKPGSGDLFNEMSKGWTSETPELIRGLVFTKAKMKLRGKVIEAYLGTALDEGYRVPDPTPARREAKVFQFTKAGGGTRYTRGHVAFDVKPHPFLRPAVEAARAPILEIIENAVAQAYANPG